MKQIVQVNSQHLKLWFASIKNTILFKVAFLDKLIILR